MNGACVAKPARAKMTVAACVLQDLKYLDGHEGIWGGRTEEHAKASGSYGSGEG
jgi:hypothetical protein